MANLQLIKDLAEKQKISIRELASRAGVTEQQIHLMVRKNSTRIDTLEKIAAILNVKAGRFFEEDDLTETDFSQSGSQNITIAQSDLERENAMLRQKLIEAQDKIIKFLEDKNNQ